jgi:hypothetical protein
VRDAAALPNGRRWRLARSGSAAMMVASGQPASVGLWPLAAAALAALAGCAPPAERERTALLCTAPNGKGFKAILDPAHDYAAFRRFPAAPAAPGRVRPDNTA